MCQIVRVCYCLCGNKSIISQNKIIEHIPIDVYPKRINYVLQSNILTKYTKLVHLTYKAVSGLNKSRT